MPLLETYGNYQLVEKLAMGGMAQLYLARRKAKGSDKTVVLKRILPHLAEDTAFVTMFLDEARIAARLHHPNVIEILDLGAEGDSYFIAMEYIHGEDLRRITKRGIELQRRMPAPLVCRVIAEACRGLDYAHKRTDAAGRALKIVHRDVSPQNILVGFDGSVKVVDFGIAKAADKATVTASGVIKGKHAYMSPEQALGREIDHRTDVFALGIVLFESLTATRLFRRATDLQTLKAVSECKVEPPSRVFPAVPQALDAILLKALTKDLTQRYQTALQLAEAIEGWLGQRSDGSKEALGAYVSQLFQDRLEREAREGKFVPTQSAIDIASVSRPSNAQNPNLPTASLRPISLTPNNPQNRTITDRQQVYASPLESRSTDVTPAFQPPDPPKATPMPEKLFVASALAKPVLTEPVNLGEPGGTVPYGRALGAEVPARPGPLPSASAEQKTITELSGRGAQALERARSSQPPRLPMPVTELRTDRDVRTYSSAPQPRMWPWWLAAGFTTIAVAGGVAKVLVDRKDLLLRLKASATSVEAAAPSVDAGAALAVKVDGEAAGANAQAVAPTAAAAAPAKKAMQPFGSVPVMTPAFPLTVKHGQIFSQLPTAATFTAGENVRIVGPARGGTRDRDFYGVASIVELNGAEARLLFEEVDTLPDGLFVAAEDEARANAAAAPVTAKGVGLVGSLQLKKNEPEADVAVKNATDFDWTQCEVRLPDNRFLKLSSNVVVRAGNTQWISGAAFKVKGGAADAKLADGFGFVKCAEGDGYLKAAVLP